MDQRGHLGAVGIDLDGKAFLFGTLLDLRMRLIMTLSEKARLWAAIRVYVRECMRSGSISTQDSYTAKKARQNIEAIVDDIASKRLESLTQGF